MALEDFQWTAILGVIGLMVGLLLPSGLGVFSNLEFNQTEIVQDPAGAITGFAVAGTSAVIIQVFSTIMGGLIMGIVGLFIDLFRGLSNNYQGGFY
jgi:hypothetical protein